MVVTNVWQQESQVRAGALFLPSNRKRNDDTTLSLSLRRGPLLRFPPSTRPCRESPPSTSSRFIFVSEALVLARLRTPSPYWFRLHHLCTKLQYMASTIETWEITSLAHKLDTINGHLLKQLTLCRQHLDDNKQREAFQTLQILFETSHQDNLKILKALICSKDDQLPPFNGSTNQRLALMC
ncbi:hypothetical protein RIF29_15351 [Crotalaria pallida]|uniref:Sieve element occlusion N-terminal domain-containing protein n=1 Tax=Crotalaria pallida TaxID=3830 RepID=A0AAN9IB40_CROPI